MKKLILALCFIGLVFNCFALTAQEREDAENILMQMEHKIESIRVALNTNIVGTVEGKAGADLTVIQIDLFDSEVVDGIDELSDLLNELNAIVEAALDDMDDIATTIR